MRNQQLIQSVTSVIALLCLATGWLNIFSPEINNLLYRKVFYIAIGVSFIFQAPLLSNPNYKYPMYIAAGLCIIGAFLPLESQFASIKTIGLFAGVILSLFNRPRVPRQ